MTEATPAIVSFFRSLDDRMGWLMSYATSLGLIACLWFAIGLALALRPHERGLPWRSAFLAAAGVVTVVSGQIASWDAAVFRSDSIDPQVARYAYDLGGISFANSWVATGAVGICAGLVMLRAPGLPRWVAWWGLVAGVGEVLARACSDTASPTRRSGSTGRGSSSSPGCCSPVVSRSGQTGERDRPGRPDQAVRAHGRGRRPDRRGVRPGVVTAFLGPNGAGKTTTLRMLLGLVRPTAGTATVGGRSYAELERPPPPSGRCSNPPGSTRGGRQCTTSARWRCRRASPGPLRAGAGPGGAGGRRGRKVGFSLGMRQRLGLAFALLGDPPVVVLDEPANGLDPQGIRWLRAVLRGLADEGRTLLVSSHVLAEVEQTADEVLILSRGRLVRHAAMEEIRAHGTLEELFLSLTEAVSP